MQQSETCFIDDMHSPLVYVLPLPLVKFFFTLIKVHDSLQIKIHTMMRTLTESPLSKNRTTGSGKICLCNYFLLEKLPLKLQIQVYLLKLVNNYIPCIQFLFICQSHSYLQN